MVLYVIPYWNAKIIEKLENTILIWPISRQSERQKRNNHIVIPNGAGMKDPGT